MEAVLAPAELLEFVPVVLFPVVLAGVVPEAIVLAWVASLSLVLAGVVLGSGRARLVASLSLVLAGVVPGVVVLAGVAGAVPVVGPLSVLTVDHMVFDRAFQ